MITGFEAVLLSWAKISISLILWLYKYHLHLEVGSKLLLIGSTLDGFCRLTCMHDFGSGLMPYEDSNDEIALGPKDKTFRSSTSFVQMNKWGRINNKRWLKVEIFEDKLVHGTMKNGREKVGPDFSLEVWVYQVASIHGSLYGGRGEVHFGGSGWFCCGGDRGVNGIWVKFLLNLAGRR